jgi:hypothetical protein
MLHLPLRDDDTPTGECGDYVELVRKNTERESKLSKKVYDKQEAFWVYLRQRSVSTLKLKTQQTHKSKYIILTQIPNLEPRWYAMKNKRGVSCNLSMESLSGGSILTINHMTSLLKNHPLKYRWENYAVKWECDHKISFDTFDKTNKCHKFKLNHFTNLRPKDGPSNKREY